MSVELAQLTCEDCGDVTEHELHYAGRLLESVRCTCCGQRIEVMPQALLPAYLHDLEQRLATKPARMWRRCRESPQAFLWSLPGALARQPVKFAREVSSLFRR